MQNILKKLKKNPEVVHKLEKSFQISINWLTILFGVSHDFKKYRFSGKIFF